MAYTRPARAVKVSAQDVPLTATWSKRRKSAASCGLVPASTWRLVDAVAVGIAQRAVVAVRVGGVQAVGQLPFVGQAIVVGIRAPGIGVEAAGGGGQGLPVGGSTSSTGISRIPFTQVELPGVSVTLNSRQTQGLLTYPTPMLGLMVVKG